MKRLKNIFLYIGVAIAIGLVIGCGSSEFEFVPKTGPVPQTGSALYPDQSRKFIKATPMPY